MKRTAQGRPCLYWNNVTWFYFLNNTDCLQRTWKIQELHHFETFCMMCILTDIDSFLKSDLRLTMKSSRRYLNVAVSFPSTRPHPSSHNQQLDSFPCDDWWAYLDTPLPVQVHGWHSCLLVHSSMGLDTLIRTYICITTFTQGELWSWRAFLNGSEPKWGCNPISESGNLWLF